MRPVHRAILAIGLLLLAGCSGTKLPPAATATTQSPFASMSPTGSTSSTTDQGLKLHGTVLLDGSVNGCGGEQVTVQVRDDTGVVGSQLVDSELKGFDCTFPFEVESPN